MALQHIPLSAIEFDPANAGRAVEIEKLARSIERVGLLQAPILRQIDRHDDELFYRVVCGERRIRALMWLNNQATVKRPLGIEAEVLDPDDGRSDAEIRLAENGNREALTSLQLLEQVVHLVEKKEQIEGIAIALGRSVGQVRKLVAVATLPKDVRKLIDTGRLSVPHGELLAQIQGDEKRQKELAKQWASDRDGHDWWDLNRCREQVLGNDWRPLKDVMWKLADVDVAEGYAISCHACPSNTYGPEPDLFDLIEDGEGPRCTNSICFRAKLHACLMREKAAGVKFREPAKPEYGWVRPGELTGYVPVSATVGSIEHTNTSTKLSTLLGQRTKPPATVFVVDRWRGHLVECLTREDARQLVTPDRKKSEEKIPLTPAEKKKRTENKARRERLEGLAHVLATAGIPTERRPAVLRWMVDDLLDRLGTGYTAKLAKALFRNTSVPFPGEPKQQLQAWLAASPPWPQLLDFYLLIRVVRESRGLDWESNDVGLIAKALDLKLKDMVSPDPPLEVPKVPARRRKFRPRRKA